MHVVVVTGGRGLYARSRGEKLECERYVGSDHKPKLPIAKAAPVGPLVASGFLLATLSLLSFSSSGPKFGTSH